MSVFDSSNPSSPLFNGGHDSTVRVPSTAEAFKILRARSSSSTKASAKQPKEQLPAYTRKSNVFDSSDTSSPLYSGPLRDNVRVPSLAEALQILRSRNQHKSSTKSKAKASRSTAKLSKSEQPPAYESVVSRASPMLPSLGSLTVDGQTVDPFRLAMSFDNAFGSMPVQQHHHRL